MQFFAISDFLRAFLGWQHLQWFVAVTTVNVVVVSIAYFLFDFISFRVDHLLLDFWIGFIAPLDIVLLHRESSC